MSLPFGTATRQVVTSQNRLAMGWSEDLAPTDPSAFVDPEAMPLDKLNGFLYDLQDQPAWRARADEECDYYDSNQLTAQQLADMQAKGLPPIVVNLVAPAINLVLGFEAKTRSDWIVKPEDEQYHEEALALTVKMKEFERLSGADRACSDAYASQIKAGLGWVEVGINRFNPFGYKFRCAAVHRREIWWDWLDDDPGLERARYLVRRKWYDVDVAEAFFPQYAGLFDHAVSNWAHFDPAMFDRGVPLYLDRSVERNFAFSDEEWRNSLRRRVCLYEVWYRTYKRGFVLRTPGGRVYEYNSQNPVHNAAITMGTAQPEAVILPKMRMSWWLGPHRLVDLPSPYPHQHFPYVPFWGYREDRSGAPYGMIRSMRPLQDEVNARRSKMLWQLSARTVISDDDAFIDDAKAMREVSRPDAWLKLNAARKNKGAIDSVVKIHANESLTNQQYMVYQDSKTSLQDAGGIYQQQLGKDGAADSGIAISQLIEQGTTTLAEINDNFRYARTRVGELGMALQQADMKGKQISVTVESKGTRKKVHFNVPAKDEDGTEYLENDVTRLQMRMGLDDVPQTPTVRAQQFMQLTDLVKALPEQLQSSVVDLVIKASDLPQKEELIQRIRGALGIQDTDPDMMSPEERKQFEANLRSQQEVEALQRRLMELEAELAEAKTGETRANTGLKKAQTAKTLVEANLDPAMFSGGKPRLRGEASAQLADEMTPEREMVERAYRDAHQPVAGADPLAMARGELSTPEGPGGPLGPSGMPATPEALVPGDDPAGLM